MRMIDDSFQNRISAEFAQMQAKLNAQAAILQAQNDTLLQVLQALTAIARTLEVEEDEEPSIVMDLEGNPVPPDRPEGEPL